jgi:hypothetical protein
VEQLHRLAVSGFSFDLLDLGIDVARGDEDIRPPFVGKVDKSRSPLHVWIGRSGHVCGRNDVGKSIFAEIFVESVWLFGVGDVEIE